MALRTDYKDDILSSGNLRKYKMINNGDGTVSFQDVTVYQQTGDTFGAGDINNTNQAVNEKLDSDDVVDPMETTKSGFAADALAVKNAINEQNKKIAEITAIIEEEFATVTSANGSGSVGGVPHNGSNTANIIFDKPFKSVPTISVNILLHSYCNKRNNKWIYCKRYIKQVRLHRTN